MADNPGPNGQPHKCTFPPCTVPAPPDQPLCAKHMEDMEFFLHMLDKVSVGHIPVGAILLAVSQRIQKPQPPVQQHPQPPKLFGPEGQKLG